jgi:hypothetical protein
MKAALIGFLACSAIPVAYGIRIMAHEVAYRDANPLGPNEVYHASGMMLAWLWILIVAPICGAIGSGITLAGASIYRRFHKASPD